MSEALHGSWPVDDPDGVVLRLWSDRGHIDITTEQLDELEQLVMETLARLDDPDEELGDE